jgi:hypothetical protein
MLTDKTDDHLALEFNDHPERFKGQRLTFTVEVPMALRPDEGLQDFKRSINGCRFTARQPGGTLTFRVFFDRPVADLPNARAGEKVLLTFDCVRGDLELGNSVFAVKRASIVPMRK